MRTPSADPSCPSAIHAQSDLDTLLPAADYVIIAAPLIYDQFTDLVQVALAQAESVMTS